ncbi:MAG: hypothetical protein IKR17_11540 [Bacteroidales bacterium]|nr:hypothetical protein [Bacteroidales bacterium]
MKLIDDLLNGVKSWSNVACNGKGEFRDYLSNVYNKEMQSKFVEMYNNGDGNELTKHAKCVRSSSMLCYNFLHWINEQNTLDLEGVNDSKVMVKYYRIDFEVQLKTIKCRGKDANLDVMLLGKGNDGKNYLLFVESKFLEPEDGGDRKFDISEKYKQSQNWYCNKGESWDKFISNIKDGIDAMKPTKRRRYPIYGGGLKQGITHLVGIANMQDSDILNDFKKKYSIDENIDVIEFVNLVFEPNAKYSNEHEDYEAYHEAYQKLIIDNAKKYGINKPGWMTYRELFNKLPPDNLKELKDYLEKRYMQFSA